MCVCLLKNFFWCDAAIPISISRPLRETFGATSPPQKSPPAAHPLPPEKNTWRMRLTTPLEWTARLPTRKIRTAGGGISSRLPIRRRASWLDGRGRPKNQRISRRRNFTNISFAVTTRPTQAVSRRLVGKKNAPQPLPGTARPALLLCLRVLRSFMVASCRSAIKILTFPMNDIPISTRRQRRTSGTNPALWWKLAAKSNRQNKQTRLGARRTLDAQRG